jgi:hypothetical protein
MLRFLVLIKETVFRKVVLRLSSGKIIVYTVMKLLRPSVSNVFGKCQEDSLWVCLCAASIEMEIFSITYG